MLFDSGAHHVGGHFYTAAVEHVQQPRQPFLEPVLIPFGCSDVRVLGIYFRQRTLCSALRLSARFHLQRDGDDQTGATGPERIRIVCLHNSSWSSSCGKCESSTCCQEL